MKRIDEEGFAEHVAPKICRQTGRNR